MAGNKGKYNGHRAGISMHILLMTELTAETDVCIKKKMFSQ